MMIRDICQKFLESGEFPQGDGLDKYRPEDVPVEPERLAEGLFAYQLALTMNMVETVNTSVKQIDLCLTLAKFFQFHLRHITDATIDQARNVAALSVFSQVRDQGLHNSQGSLGIAMEIFKQLGLKTDSPEFAKLRAVGDGIQKVAIFADKNLALATTYINLSSQRGYNIFPEEHNTEPLQANETAFDQGRKLTEEFNAGQLKLVGAVDDVLGTMLSRIQYIREVVIPAAPDVTATWNEDIEYNIGFIKTLMGWQGIFDRISNNNEIYTREESPFALKNWRIPAMTCG